MRQQYQMRRVVREFVYYPWAIVRHEADRSLQRIPKRYVELSCGHWKRDPWEVYANETAVRLADVLHHLFTPDETRKSRCYHCAREALVKTIGEPTQ